MKHLYGMTCATITPMFADGSVDNESARKLYRHLTRNGVHSLYPNGTNGESLLLSKEERDKLANICMDEAAGKSVIYIQCGASTVMESYRHVLYAKAIGADGAGLMTPVFFPVDELEMEEYYSRALEIVQDFPLYVYNIPSRTGNDVSPALFDRLSRKYANLIGIKYSSSDLPRLIQYVNANMPKGSDVLIGNDHLALACLILGGKGYVSGPGAVFPKLFVSLYEAFCAGNMDEAMEIQKKITSTLNGMKGIPEIPAIKYLLRCQGVIACDVCRSPLRALTTEEKKRLDALL